MGNHGIRLWSYTTRSKSKFQQVVNFDAILAADAGCASAGESAAWMLRSRLHGWIYADPAEALPVADAGHWQASGYQKQTTQSGIW